MCYTSLATNPEYQLINYVLSKEDITAPSDHKDDVSCNTNTTEDEFHFVLMCPFYEDIRSKYIKQYYRLRPSVFKLVQQYKRIM